MGEKSLISPRFRVRVGQWELQNGMDIECFSSRESHMDWCKIKLATELFHKIDFKDMDVAKIELGYENDFDLMLSGYARKGTGDYWKEIIIKDDLIKLERTKIKQTFIDCTPQDVLFYILTTTGVANYKLSGEAYGKRKTFIIDRQNAVDAIKDINNGWEIQKDFFFQDGMFYWGTKKEQTEQYVLEEGRTILRLNKYGNLWEAETIAIPWIHHSQTVEVLHRKFSGIAEVQRTIVRSSKNGIKMYIYF